MSTDQLISFAMQALGPGITAYFAYRLRALIQLPATLNAIETDLKALRKGYNALGKRVSSLERLAKAAGKSPARTLRTRGVRNGRASPNGAKR